MRKKIKQLLGNNPIDILLSDMAPNATGHGEMDHTRIIELNTHLLDFCVHVLKQNGTLVCKIWDGGRTRHFMNTLETVFKDVRIVKPDASRVNSAELFLLARDYTNPKYEIFKLGEPETHKHDDQDTK